MRKITEKKSDIASMIYIVIFISIVGLVLLLIVHMNNELFGEITDKINETYSGTTAVERSEEFETKNASRLWDYAFLGIFLGSLIAVALSAYATRISPIFYWVYVLISLFILGVGILMSNLWQDMIADAEFTSIASQFTITNTILGSYYPMIITFVIFLFMIILFGKPPGQEGYF